MPSDRNGRSSHFFLPNSGKVHWGSPSTCKFELHFLGPTNGTSVVFAVCFYVPKEGIGVTNPLSFFFTLFVALSYALLQWVSVLECLQQDGRYETPPPPPPFSSSQLLDVCQHICSLSFIFTISPLGGENYLSLFYT